MSNTNQSAVVQPYLFFNGNCEEAVDFYKKAIGAEVEMMMRFKDSPEPPQPGMVPPGAENKIMHTTFRVGQTRVMASDGCMGQDIKFSGFSLSLAVHEVDEAKRAFAALSEGGKVMMPLSPTFWSPLFGMAEDRYGVGWMVSVISEQHKPS